MINTRMRLAGVVLLMLGMAGSQAHSAHAQTTVTVNNCSSEFGSGGTDIGIGNAIQQANTDKNDDTIQFSCSGTIPITRTLHPAVIMLIDGGHNVTLDGGGSPNGTELFMMYQASGTVTLENLTLQNGFNSQGGGGAIWSQGSSVQILNSTVTGNSTGSNGTLNYAGGAIVNSAGATLTVSNSTFSANTSGNGAGGGIDNGGTATVLGSTFTGNSSAKGGAIENDSGTASLTIFSSTFSDNSGTSSACCASGGAIDNWGTVTVSAISGSSFSGNSAQFGGAIVNHSGATFSATDTTFADNTVSGTAANGGASGGAISNQGTISLDRSTLSGNSGPDGGAIDNEGTVSVVDSTLAGNSATDAGGAYWDANNPGSRLTLTDSTVANNTAPTGEQFDNGGQLAIGGSIVSDTSGGNCVAAVTTDNGYNLEWSGTGHADTCGFTGGTDVTGQDSQLGALTNNGGATLTMALRFNSPALDANSCSFTDASGNTISTDQRGNSRPDDGEAACDIGAYEASYTETATAVGFTPTAAVYGQTVSYGVGVTAGGQPVTSGSVTIMDGSRNVCGGAEPVDPQTGTTGCFADPGSVGQHRINAAYGGGTSLDGTLVYQASLGSSTLTVSPATTTTSVSSSSGSSTVGQSITFTATISPEYTGTPSGTVDFYDNGTKIGSGTLNGSSTNDQATFSTTGLAAGTHSITASYGGDSNFTGSSSTSSASVQVSYTVHVLSTSRLTIALQLWNSSNTNVSSSSLRVTAVCVVANTGTAPTTCPTNPVQTINQPFTFVPASKKGTAAQYSYKLSTQGLTRNHSYYLLIQPDGNPAEYAVQFTD